MSYISEDDRIDREQEYRRKLREAASPDQPATNTNQKRKPAMVNQSMQIDRHDDGQWSVTLIDNDTGLTQSWGGTMTAEKVLEIAGDFIIPDETDASAAFDALTGNPMASLATLTVRS